MGLKQLLNTWERSSLSNEVAQAAEEVIPDFFITGERDAGIVYREHVLQDYIELENSPQKCYANGRFRSPQKARLDRAWTRTAERMDVSEGNIRNCVLAVYEHAGDYETKTDRLRNDFDEILRRASR
ncbi:hypothetical protein JCM17823_16170 [Halorubrum gandharaense]